MESKKLSLVETAVGTIDAETMNRRAFLGTLLSMTAGGAGLIGYSVNKGSTSAKFDVEQSKQKSFDAAIETELRQWDKHVAIQQSLEQLPEDFNEEHAKKQFVKKISPNAMKQAKERAEYFEQAAKSRQIGETIMGTIVGGVVGGVTGAILGSDIGIRIENEIVKMQNDIDEKLRSDDTENQLGK